MSCGGSSARAWLLVVALAVVLIVGIVAAMRLLPPEQLPPLAPPQPLTGPILLISKRLSTALRLMRILISTHRC